MSRFDVPEGSSFSIVVHMYNGENQEMIKREIHDGGSLRTILEQVGFYLTVGRYPLTIISFNFFGTLTVMEPLIEGEWWNNHIEVKSTLPDESVSYFHAEGPVFFYHPNLETTITLRSSY